LSTPTSATLASRFWALARTPKWIAALVLSLAIAATFAALGQWQLERSIDNATVSEIDTETVVPLEELAEPASGMTEVQAGRIVSVSGDLIVDDTVAFVDRPDGFGGTGTWLVGHIVTDGGVSVAVVLGSTPGGSGIGLGDSSLDEPGRDWVGRYLPSEEPQASDFENGVRSSLSVAELVNLWAEPGPVYAGFIVLDEPHAGLDPIRAVAPVREATLNLPNVLYAIEWLLFGGFAIYLWYRLVRDGVERADDDPSSAALTSAAIGEP
jgi:surfeit locus 1 family protein